MNRPLLILHERHTPDDSDIWRVAVRRGWVTERVNRFNVAARLPGHSPIRYYGNLLHLDQIRDQLPIRFHELDVNLLPMAEEFTRRNIQLLRYGDLVQPIRRRCFIKPACVKWFEARVYEPGQTVEGAPSINDWVYVQDVVSGWRDEIRCFCVDGEVLTSSFYRVNRVVWDQSGLPEDQLNYDSRLGATPIPEYVKSMYATLPMPRAVVADFFRYEDGSWSLIEFNEPWASGLYWCDPERCFDCVIASQEGRVSDQAEERPASGSLPA